MSLELALKETTAALHQLIEILSKGATPAPQPAGLTLEQTFEEPAPKTKKAKKDEPAPAPAPEPETPKAVTYTDVAKAITALINACGQKTDRARAIVQSFGVKNSPQLKEEQYPAVIAQLSAALNEVTTKAAA